MATGYVTEAVKFGCAAVFAGLLDNSALTQNIAGTSWWARVDGATWNMPEGPGSSAESRLNHPVTQVSWNDALAFAAWSVAVCRPKRNGSMPLAVATAAAAIPGAIKSQRTRRCIAIFGRGTFHTRTRWPTASSPPAGTQLRADRARPLQPCRQCLGMDSDPFRVGSLSRQAKMRNQQSRKDVHKVLKGGSFLYHKSYCFRYRIAARMGLSPDSASSNAGFRIAYDSRPGDTQGV